ncbi:actin-related protein 2/3 complex subunit 2B [Malania oleifera]|uniref:actin-related protein 2/3 complex subunit 2B n=1 Tax=Malania oleifera TaxID=397392 RepID=UPI0025AE4780|nr:actin-related protein 2/3 complex subunit 2B [Malania oleifera]
MACFEKASRALKEILLKLHSAEQTLEIDHYLYEFGSVKYHIQSSASDPHHAYLSISTPLLSQGVPLSYGLPHYMMQLVKGICSDAVEIVEHAKEGYQLTLRLNFSKIPKGKESVKIITEISTVQTIILSSQLKEILRNASSKDTFQGIYKPIKLVYHPREPFFVIIQTDEITAVFPMRFKDKSDVILATAFFQELMDVGRSEAGAKAPPCTWSPIPPPELRGEPFEDLSTNGGFVSFEISSRHIERKRLDKTVWSLLNFYACVKYHIKSTRGFLQRRMRKRMEGLVEVLQKASIEEDVHFKKIQGCRCVRKLKTKTLKQGCKSFKKKIKRIRSRIKIHRFSHFRRRWLTIPKFSSALKYTKLD